MRKFFEKVKDNRGFTLIEIAIVLILIGIIIGAVVKGKDLIRSGEQKKIYTKYINAWQMAYSSFYDRTGKRLGDFRDSSGAAGQDGKCETDENGSGVDNTDRQKLIDGPSTGTAYYGLDSVGLESPKTNTDNDWEYRYTDTEGTSHLLAIAFVNDNTNNYNFMEIQNIPNELCMALDTLIDGEADGTDGDFIGNLSNGEAWDREPTTVMTARLKLQF